MSNTRNFIIPFPFRFHKNPLYYIDPPYYIDHPISIKQTIYSTLANKYRPGGSEYNKLRKKFNKRKQINNV